MTSIHKNTQKILSVLTRAGSSQQTALTISKELGISTYSAWRTLKELERGGIVTLVPLSKSGKTSSHSFIELNTQKLKVKIRNKPSTVSEYINQASPLVRKKLKDMRAILKEVTPGAEESIKWGNPAFSYERVLYIYGGFKNHVSFYPTPSAINAFKKELKDYETGKGSIKFPLDGPLPKTLIKKIAKFRIQELKEKDAKWL